MASKPGSGRRGPVGLDHGVAHARVGHALDIGDDEAHVAGGEFVEHDGLGRERAERFHFVDLVARAQANLHPRRDAALHHAHEDDRAAVDIEPGIENQRAQRRVRRALSAAARA